MATPSYGANALAGGVPNTLINQVNATFDKIFSNAMIAFKPQATFVAQRTSTGKTINLAAALQVPRVRIWKDQKHLNQVGLVAINVPMFPLEASIRIDKYDMMGDAVGLYADSIRALAMKAKSFTDETVANALQSGYGASYTGYWAGTEYDFGETGNISGDNLSFFNSSHVWPGTNVTAQTNMVTGSLADPSTFGAAVNLMRGFLGNQGQPLQVQPKTLVFGPADEYNVTNAIDAKITAVGFGLGSFNGGTGHTPQVALDNVINRYGLGLCRLDWLQNDPGVAYLLGECGGVGCAYQYMLDPLHLVPSVNPTDKSVFYDREFVWSVEGFGRIVLPWWFTAVRIVAPNATYQ